jgi:glycosyltransferase involved in cell wall biosynthesis
LVDGLSDYYKLLYKIIQNYSFDDLVEFKKDSNSQELLSKYEMNNKNSKISVIIPVYNGAKYLRECLDSVVNQTLGIENIEVIVVDDSSTDNSVDIIKEYASKYPSFKLIKQEPNQGSGPARNLGLKHVTNDYVTYLDCDDYISLDAYEKA